MTRSILLVMVGALLGLLAIDKFLMPKDIRFKKKQSPLDWRMVEKAWMANAKDLAAGFIDPRVVSDERKEKK